jgi:glycosyltransferase involved in cell wall biosynthesis
VGDTFKIRIVGPGDDQWARAKAAEHGVSDLTEWLGFLTKQQLIQALASADVFVLPTREDTYAVVVHEAACLSLPLIISQHAGAAEVLVNEGVNGYVIDPEDTANFAGRMKQLMDSDLRKVMATESRAIGEHYSSPNRGAALWKSLVDTFHPH